MSGSLLNAWPGKVLPAISRTKLSLPVSHLTWLWEEERMPIGLGYLKPIHMDMDSGSDIHAMQKSKKTHIRASLGLAYFYKAWADSAEQ